MYDTSDILPVFIIIQNIQMQKGRIVKIGGLVKRADLNGRLGKTVQYLDDRGRWEVKMSQQKTLAIRPSNLIMMSPMEASIYSAKGHGYEVHDITKEMSEINGTFTDMVAYVQALMDNALCKTCYLLDWKQIEVSNESIQFKKVVGAYEVNSLEMMQNLKRALTRIN